MIVVVGRVVTDAGRREDLKRIGQAEQTDVDVELVIAVDISYSMDPDEQALQREGYILGLTSPEFLNALRQGMHGRVALDSCDPVGGGRSGGDLEHSETREVLFQAVRS